MSLTRPVAGLQTPGLAKTGRASRARRVFAMLLGALRSGSVRVTFPDGVTQDLGSGPLAAQLTIRDESVFGHTLAYGDIGFAECWMDGRWSVDDLAALLTVLARERDAIARGLHGEVLFLLGHKLWTLFRANTRRGARKNIEAHYDLGNDFYRLWLDPTMTYSSAWFGENCAGEAAASTGLSLEDAQRAKVRRMLVRAGVQVGDRVLEIGCGWGGLAEIAATEFGAHVHGITLSPAQLAFAQERAQRGGWADRASFELRDYRDVTETFDRIVSCEMFEAVGEAYWPSYFAQVSRCLKPGGRAVVQTITIRDDLFPAYRKGTDFIQRYIFPGGKLPSPGVFARLAGQAGLRVDGDLAFGSDYARTLAEWDRRFVAVHDAVIGMGYDERFCRMWRFYLAYCEAGFTAGSIDVHQFELMHV
ncbi:MAG: class I SAM-dependent methyltransferase [Betaproteobacteria bacterium]|nr:class I SAM-dependent methyltransferase [Betaproteobacteria bacterium]